MGVTKRVWVRRPGSTPTAVHVGEEDLVDDLKTLVLQKYPTTLAVRVDPADLVIRCGAKILAPDETVWSVLEKDRSCLEFANALVLEASFGAVNMLPPTPASPLRGDPLETVHKVPPPKPEKKLRPPVGEPAQPAAKKEAEKEPPKKGEPPKKPPKEQSIKATPFQGKEAVQANNKPEQLKKEEPTKEEEKGKFKPKSNDATTTNDKQIRHMTQPSEEPPVMKSTLLQQTIIQDSYERANMLEYSPKVQAASANHPRYILDDSIPTKSFKTMSKSEQEQVRRRVRPPLATLGSGSSTTIKTNSPNNGVLLLPRQFQLPKSMANKAPKSANDSTAAIVEKGDSKLQTRINVPVVKNVVPQINVLIVEDNVINQRILEAFMRRKKIRSAVAKNGREAVDKWRQGGFHLVLMDIQLPVMSGIEATKEIRRLEHDNRIGVFSSDNKCGDALTEEDRLDAKLFRSPVIIVALTASSSSADKSEALAAGCNDFLTKPVNLLWLEQKTIEWGCMQALIDFEGWKHWAGRDGTTRNASKPTKKIAVEPAK
ncbi:hypothetical protein TRVA0_008S00694 [Trichomonascus vanleenenianus]|uniref:mitogen-activated protein kinase kinase kinase SSK1 n=1 Tax=Trichomonascus vanleenenianus TaxID=2268995 RepID=UPI003ECA23D1